MASHKGGFYTYEYPTEVVTDRKLSNFNAGDSLPRTDWDLGVVSVDKKVLLYLHNGGTTNMSFQGFTATGTEGIEVLEPEDIAFPVTIEPRRDQAILILVTTDGPVEFDALFTFNTDLGDVVFRVFGVRNTYLSGIIAYLIWQHNWGTDYEEILQWRTEVMTAYDGTEQRVGSMPLPRRSYKLDYLESGREAELLHTYLASRRVNYYYIPTWHDIGLTTGPVLEGEFHIPVDTRERDYIIGQKVVIFIGAMTYEYGVISTMTDLGVTLDGALRSDYPTNTKIAPLRAYQLSSGVSVKKHSDQTLEMSCSMMSVHDTEHLVGYVAEMYEDYEVLPLDLNFTVTDDPIAHKWVTLDSGINLPEIVKESINPVYNSKLEFLATNRAEGRVFLEFLQKIRGQANPFWLVNKGLAFELAEPLVLDSATIFIKFTSYAHSSFGEKGKEYIEILYTDGSVERLKILEAEYNPADPDIEELSITPTISADRAVEEVISIRYLQLSRFATDSFTLKWLTEGRFSCSLPIKVLT